MIGFTANCLRAKSIHKILYFPRHCFLRRLNNRSVSVCKEPFDYQESLDFEEDKKFLRKKSNFIVPIIGEVVRQSVQTAVGVYVTNSTVSWAKVSRENLLTEWTIVPIELNAKKWHISSVYETVRSIFPLIPHGDLYVLEDLKKPSVNQLSNPLMVSNIRLMESTLSMMYLYLNNLFKNLQEPGVENQHNVFFLRSLIVARLSATHLGNERISAEDIVMGILNSSENLKKVHQFTPLKIGLDLNETFFGKSSVEKECLYRALLLVMSFMDIVIRERRESLRFINK